MWLLRGKCTIESTSIVGVPGIYLWIRDIVTSEYLVAAPSAQTLKDPGTPQA